MLGKLFSHRKNETNSSSPPSKHGQTVHISPEDMLRYEFQDLLFQKVFETEAALHNEEDPMVIATRVMQTACDPYVCQSATQI